MRRWLQAAAAAVAAVLLLAGCAAAPKGSGAASALRGPNSYQALLAPAEGEAPPKADRQRAAQVLQKRLEQLDVEKFELTPDESTGGFALCFKLPNRSALSAETLVEELVKTAAVTFRLGAERQPGTGAPAGVTAQNVLLGSSDILWAEAKYGELYAGVMEYYVELTLTEAGAQTLYEVTDALAQDGGGVLSIWVDDEILSAPTVQQAIQSEKLVISGDFTAESAGELAAQISAGALPYALVVQRLQAAG